MGSFGSSSGSSSGSSRNTTQPYIPPYLQGILGQVSGQDFAGLSTGQIPSLGNLIQGYPLQGVQPLTGQQTQNINQFESIATNPYSLNPAEMGSLTGYQNLTGGLPWEIASDVAMAGPNSYETQAADIYGNLAKGPNTAVPYGQNVLNSLITPTINSQATLSGLGNSGAANENIALAGEQMALPMAEQGLNLEASAASGLAGLGGQVTGEKLAAAGQLGGLAETQAGGEAALGPQAQANLQQALVAAGMPQQNAQQVLNALYQRSIGQTQLGVGAQQTLMNWLLGLTGRTSTGTETGNQSGSNLNFGFGPDSSLLSSGDAPWWLTGIPGASSFFGIT